MLRINRDFSVELEVIKHVVIWNKYQFKVIPIQRAGLLRAAQDKDWLGISTR